jgi:type VI protein secretion system component VasA
MSLGYRLLLEYFYYRRQFLSFELQGLQKLHAISGNTFSVCIYFDELEPNIQKACTKESILTSVVPAVNLNAIYLDSIVFDYTQFDYPLRVGQSGAQPKIYAVTEVENREPVDWKFHGGEKPRLELSLPPHKKLAAEPEVVRAKAWVYDAAFGDRQYALQSSESLLPIESIKTIYTCTAQDWWQHNENLLPWVNHLQFGLGQLQQKNGLAFLKNHLSLYLNKREPWQKKSIESLRALKISNIIKRLPREVYAVGPVVHIAIEIDHAAFASHSLYLFAQLLECIFLSLVEVGTGLQVVIQDQYQNICYQGSLKLGAAK